MTKKAGLLPIEYLIVDMPAAFAKAPIYAFNEGSPLVKSPFPIENRAEIGEIQSFDSVQSYMQQFPSHKFLEAMSCFHFLTFLVTNQAVHFDVRSYLISHNIFIYSLFNLFFFHFSRTS